MIAVSDNFKTAIDADKRKIVPKVEVFFDGDTQPPTVFEGDDIVSIRLLEESKADSGNPLGLVSANEVTISLSNAARAFTPSNTGSPYYGKLRPKVKIKPYLGLRLPDGSYEYVPLGVFRTGDWNAPSTGLEATVTCYDRIYDLMEKDIPMIPVMKDTTVKAMFEALFSALGLTPDEYDVDESLTQSISRGWFENNKVRDGLNALAVAGNCNITISRTDVVRVRPNNPSGAVPVATMTDGNQILTGENPQKYLDTYSTVRVKYRVPYLRASEVVLKVEGLGFNPGNIVLTPLYFSAGPVMGIEQIKITGGENISVSEVSCGAWSMAMTVTNSGEIVEFVTIEVWGRIIDTVGAEHEETDPEAVFTKTLTIESSMIQGEAAASAYASNLLAFVKDPQATFQFQVRGNPAIELYDPVRFIDPSDKIDGVTAAPTRISLEYDGALSGSIVARKVV